VTRKGTERIGGEKGREMNRQGRKSKKAKGKEKTGNERKI
jgi:hypothetical protein